jgi:serine/threonine-protein kinase
VILVSLGLYFCTRWRACDCTLVLHLGLFYEIALALAIGIVNQWTPNTTGLSWICVLVLIHPMIVPHRRRWTLLAALAAASMDPVGLAITKARGVAIPSFPELLWYLLPNYICALLAVLPSHVVSRLGHEVSRARELGSYRLGALLGRGGMGEVYSARHRLLRRPAAIKLIRPEALGANGHKSRTVIRRFRREAEAVANLHSPHTIVLYDFGVTREGDFYYVMELLDGLDLESLVERFGPVRPARTVHLLRQACHSLAEAHARELVHRDVKPSNLFTCRVGLESDFVKLLDFGLVKGHFDDKSQVKLTAPDVTTGTPAYMAPELALGEQTDGRADVYALGCVGYWLLTGRTVFEEETPTRMILAHVRKRPDPPSTRSEVEIGPDLDALILDCLKKDPADRPQTAEELAERLSSCKVGPPWTQRAADRWWHKHMPELMNPTRIS